MRILVTSPFFGRYSVRALARLEQLGCVLTRLTGSPGEDALSDVVVEADAWIVGLQSVSADLLGKSPKLKVVCVHGVGVDHVDLEAATRFGILVTNTPGTNAAAVAELTMGLILSLARELVQANDLLRDRQWELLVGAEVGGKILGIIGFGAIGRKVASLAKCFGMEVIAYSPRAGKDRGAAPDVRFASLHEVLQEADYVSIHTSLRDETRHLVGERELRLMKGVACLVNTARGGIVDEEALYRVLVERRIRGAALDVFASEPAIGSRLIGLPGVIATPHIGGSTGEAFARTSESVADSVEAVSRGEQPTRLVNPGAWLRYAARWA